MTHRMTWYLVMAATALLLHAGSAQALPGFDTAVVEQYATATNLESCGTCHNDFSPGGTSLNPYGQAVSGALSGFDVAQALTDVESLDSDGDGTSNIDEINTDAGFFPGWTCETYSSAINAPGNLADLVDPVDPACDGVTTTSTVTSTTVTVTSTSTSTSTTVPVDHTCSQPVTTGPEPLATDCLYILQAAVHTVTCSPECICAPTGTLPIKATDALLCLNVTVGIVFPLDCPCGGGTSTTVTSSTVTSTTVTSTTETSTTVTSTSSTTEDSTTTTSTLP